MVGGGGAKWLGGGGVSVCYLAGVYPGGGAKGALPPPPPKLTPAGLN